MNAELRKQSPRWWGIRRRVLLLCTLTLVGILFATLRWRGVDPIPMTGAPELPSPESGIAVPLSDGSLPLPPAPPAQPSVPFPPPTPYARQLVNAIAGLDHRSVPLTSEAAQDWKRSIDALIQQGPTGVSAITEFLEKNTDTVFGSEGRRLLGFDSARAALFDALVQIGGAEGLSATLQALQNTGDPREIALLAQNLEKLAPELYRTEALNAAREVLATASTGELAGADVAPLFEVFQHYGGADIVPDLEQARRHWEYYSAITLAQLPDGHGIPSLIQIAQADSAGATTALQLLAQLSGHAEARSALLEMARRNGISSVAWPFLVSALAGNEYCLQNSAFVGPEGRAHPDNVSIAHVKSGNQSFYSAFSRGSLTPEQINQRLSFIDELRSITADPATLEALRQAADLLLARQFLVAATSP